MLERRSCRASETAGRSGTWSRIYSKPKRAVLWISGGTVDACLPDAGLEVHFAAQTIAQLVREKAEISRHCNHHRRSFFL